MPLTKFNSANKYIKKRTAFAVRFITFAVQIDFYAEIFVRKEKYEL